MASNNVNLGGGRGTGMFYHAPADTALPDSPGATLDTAWKDAGYISADGITWTPFGSINVLRNWANDAVRRFQEERGSVSGAVISTTEESLKALFGADAVSVTAASAAHGKLISVDTSDGPMSGEEAFLFIGKDGEDLFMLGCTHGMITNLADVSFTPSDAIAWTPTIEGAWTFMKDDGQISG